jgi:Domain of unknown function (DUF4148)
MFSQGRPSPESASQEARSIIMKSDSIKQFVDQPLRALVVASAVLMATSTSLYAQTSSAPAAHQLTRAEVRHELEELEAAGYNPALGDDVDYPADIQAAEAKVAAKHQAERNAVAGVVQIGPTTPTP